MGEPGGMAMTAADTAIRRRRRCARLRLANRHGPARHVLVALRRLGLRHLRRRLNGRDDEMVGGQRQDRCAGDRQRGGEDVDAEVHQQRLQRLRLPRARQRIAAGFQVVERQQLADIEVPVQRCQHEQRDPGANPQRLAGIARHQAAPTGAIGMTAAAVAKARAVGGWPSEVVAAIDTSPASSAPPQLLPWPAVQP